MELVSTSGQNWKEEELCVGVWVSLCVYVCLVTQYCSKAALCAIVTLVSTTLIQQYLHMMRWIIIL